MKIKLQYEYKRMAEYLDTGKYKRVLLRFYHGLGDAIAFHCNVMPYLRAKYPDIYFAVSYHNGQSEVFGYVDENEAHYDIAFVIMFLCSEWEKDNDLTKSEKCFIEDLGLPLIRQCDKYSVPLKFGSPLVGVHFHSTSCDYVSATDECAKIIWDKINERGLIPIDTHFVHPHCRNVKKHFNFENRFVDDIKDPSVGKIFGLIGSLGGFAGVSGGNFWTALCCLQPEKILYIETEFPATKLTRLPVHHWKHGESTEALDRWLDCVVI